MSTSIRSGMIFRDLGSCDYTPVWRAMQQFTATRTAHNPDELWRVEHPAVFTQGLNGKSVHVLSAGDIPVIPVDRGGQVTYHGPGQLVMYLLIDLNRRGIGVRDLVSLMEQSVVSLLAGYGIDANARANAPGVYIGAAKVAALGLRVRGGCSYHGLSLNVDMDLTPFARIHPCGYQGMAVTQLRAFGITDGLPLVAEKLLNYLTEMLGENIIERFDHLPAQETLA